MVAAMILLATEQPARPQGSSAASTPFPLGIAAPVEEIAFVRISKEVGQLDLKSGKVLRSWAVNGQPVGVFEARLVVVERDTQTNRLQVSLLETGVEQAVRKIPVTFPEGIDIGDQRFCYLARVTGNTLHLEWRLEGSYSGGAPANPRVARSYSTSRSGALKVNLTDGQVFAAGLSDSSSPAASASDSRFPYQRRYPEWKTEPWRSNAVTAWLEAEPAGEKKIVFLHINSGERDAKFALVAAHDPFAFLALDGSAVLALASPPDATQRSSLFSVSTGQKIGEVSVPQGLREFAVIGSRIYWLTAFNQGSRESQQLAADDLASDKDLWRLDVGSTPSPVRQIRHP
jgi:hypothetical protein